MVWELQRQGSTILYIVIDERLLSAISHRSEVALVRNMDPYANGALDKTGQEAWLGDARSLRAELEANALTLAGFKHPPPPEDVVQRFLDAERTRNRALRELSELIAFLELAVTEGQAIVACVAD
jgi:hypothetical protein